MYNRKSRTRSKQLRNQRRQEEQDEIELLNQWIDCHKPDCGINPLSLPDICSDSRVGRLPDGTFPQYAGSAKFIQLPLSKKTKDGLTKAGYVSMTKIQRASLPHSLCGRDILGAAKTGSGKTLAFVIPVLEKLYRERWSPDDGVGSIIISPTRELAAQLFDVLQQVGKFHGFSAGLFIGGREDVDSEKECANNLNILVCTPGRLLQHMDETPNFDCSQLQVLVLDEADRILDIGFKKTLNAIVSQLPKQRQTLLFSATQTKSVQDLARLSLKDPEYVSVVESSTTPTPNRLQQTAIEVPLDQKLNMLWSFIKSHLNSKILVFLSSCKQVKFIFKVFKALHPGIPLKCLHGRMKQEKRMAVYSQFCEGRAVLFSTDVASRGLDFNKAVDWVVQVDCPEDVASYIHRAGRTARYLSGGKSVLFLTPSEIKMLDRLKNAKIPIQLIKPNKKKLQHVSAMLSSLLVKDKDLQNLAQRAFITYLRSIHIQKDREIFDVMKLPVDEFAASFGLPMTPRIRFVSKKGQTNSENQNEVENSENLLASDSLTKDKPRYIIDDDNDVLFKNEENDPKLKISDSDDKMYATRVLKKKKLKINIHRPVGTRVVFDDEGRTLPPLAQLADSTITDETSLFNEGERDEYYRKLRDDLKKADQEDKLFDRQRRRDKRIREKVKLKEKFVEDENGEEDDEERSGAKLRKITFDSDDESYVGMDSNTISLAEQEALALKLLQSIHK